MEKLDQYFNEVKQINELIPLSEISEIISVNKKSLSTMEGLLNKLQHDGYAHPALATLIAIVIIIGFSLLIDRDVSNNKIFIPEKQQRVFQLVQNVQAQASSSQITLSQFGDSNQDKSLIPIHLRTKFVLSEEKLKLLGITFDEKLIKYEGNIKTKGYVSFSVEMTQSVSVSVNKDEREGVQRYSFYPWFLSNEEGVQRVRYRFDNEDSLKMTNSYFNSTIDQLIPIQISRPGFLTVIFWYSQTPELMNILESEVTIRKPTRVSSEAYVIESTAEVMLYPTITKGPLQLSVNVIKDQHLEVTIINSSGTLVFTPVNNEHINAGQHTFEINLSEFDRGLYFLRVHSKPGLVSIHRIFKE